MEAQYKLVPLPAFVLNTHVVFTSPEHSFFLTVSTADIARCLFNISFFLPKIKSTN